MNLVFAAYLLCLSVTIGKGGQASSLTLTADPPTSSEGELLTMSCSGSADLVEVAWFRNVKLILYTKLGNTIRKPIVNIDQYQVVSGRINARTSRTQHNLTISINPTLDAGSKWVCYIEKRNLSSNTLTINVLQHTTAKVSSGITLIQHPIQVVDGELLILSCSDTTELLTVRWFQDLYILFETKSGETTIYESTISPEKYKLLSERISATTSFKQHNVTLRINSSLDEVTKWHCRSGGDVSNAVTIHVSKYVTTRSPFITTTLQDRRGLTTESSSNITTPTVMSEDSSTLVYIVMATVFGIVIKTVLIVVICVSKKRLHIRSQKDNRTGIRLEAGDEKNISVMVDNILYASYTASHYSTSAEDHSEVNTEAKPEETDNLIMVDNILYSSYTATELQYN